MNNILQRLAASLVAFGCKSYRFPIFPIYPLKGTLVKFGKFGMSFWGYGAISCYPPPQDYLKHCLGNYRFVF